MDTNIRPVSGNWDAGYVLDKHMRSSVYVGDNSSGHPQFENTRSQVGEALYQLKYRHDWSQVSPLAAAIATTVIPLLGPVELIVPMPASIVRQRQPVTEIVQELGKLLKVPVFDGIIVKSPAAAGARQLKDMGSREEKVTELASRFVIHDAIENHGCCNALLVDDLFDTGASMEAACATLRTYTKIKNIYAVALTWK
jgi:predicted amidophosphoribosyltransferase